MKPELLLIAGDPGLRGVLGEFLVANGYAVRFAPDGATGIQFATQGAPSAALLDCSLPDTDGPAVLRGLLQARPSLPVLVSSARPSWEQAVEAMKLGAFEYIAGPASAENLLRLLRDAVAHDRFQSEARSLSRDTLERFDMVGSSEPMLRVAEAISRVAVSNAGVLICGESGTGKELVARAIHRESPRAGRPFVKLNCAAIPQELVESELFGYEKGAFTGAYASKQGKLEAADRGTLFLDEVGDMSVHAQAKLLRFLQEGELEHVGGTAAVRVDARVLAATNKAVREEILAGRFREDLYYRLNVVTVVVPPLRERRDDIPLLAEHFLARFCERDGLARKTLTRAAARLLAAQPWTGNVRELENTIYRVAVMADEPVLTANSIRPFLQPGDCAVECAPPDDLSAACLEFEREYVCRALAHTGWNVAAAARLLGIERPSLHRKLARLSIARNEFTGRSERGSGTDAHGRPVAMGR